MIKKKNKKREGKIGSRRFVWGAFFLYFPLLSQINGSRRCCTKKCLSKTDQQKQCEAFGISKLKQKLSPGALAEKKSTQKFRRIQTLIQKSSPIQISSSVFCFSKCQKSAALLLDRKGFQCPSIRAIRIHAWKTFHRLPPFSITSVYNHNLIISQYNIFYTINQFSIKKKISFTTPDKASIPDLRRRQ